MPRGHALLGKIPSVLARLVPAQIKEARWRAQMRLARAKRIRIAIDQQRDPDVTRPATTERSAGIVLSHHVEYVPIAGRRTIKKRYRSHDRLAIMDADL